MPDKAHRDAGAECRAKARAGCVAGNVTVPEDWLATPKGHFGINELKTSQPHAWPLVFQRCESRFADEVSVPIDGESQASLKRVLCW